MMRRETGDWHRFQVKICTGYCTVAVMAGPVASAVANGMNTKKKYSRAGATPRRQMKNGTLRKLISRAYFIV
jgi:hypothetical protein